MPERKRVDARVTETLVEIFCDGQLVKTWWPRAQRGRRTDNNDYPPEKIAFFIRTQVWCRSRVEAHGEHVTELVVGLLADHALHHLRAAQGIIGLADRYGADRVDAACQRALQVGDPSYTVKCILAVGADKQRQAGEVDSAASALTPTHLHGPDGLFAHLEDDAAGDDSDGDDGDEAVGA